MHYKNKFYFLLVVSLLSFFAVHAASPVQTSEFSDSESSESLCERGEDAFQGVLDERTKLYEQLKSLVEMLEKKGVDGSLIVDDTFYGLYYRGHKALKIVLEECNALEEKTATLEDEIYKVEKEEKDFKAVVAKLSAVVEEVNTLERERKKLEERFIKVGKAKFFAWLILGGVTLSAATVITLLLIGSRSSNNW